MKPFGSVGGQAASSRSLVPQVPPAGLVISRTRCDVASDAQRIVVGRERVARGSAKVVAAPDDHFHFVRSDQVEAKPSFGWAMLQRLCTTCEADESLRGPRHRDAHLAKAGKRRLCICSAAPPLRAVGLVHQCRSSQEGWRRSAAFRIGRRHAALVPYMSRGDVALSDCPSDRSQAIPRGGMRAAAGAVALIRVHGFASLRAPRAARGEAVVRRCTSPHIQRPGTRIAACWQDPPARVDPVAEEPVVAGRAVGQVHACPRRRAGRPYRRVAVARAACRRHQAVVGRLVAVSAHSDPPAQGSPA